MGSSIVCNPRLTLTSALSADASYVHSFGIEIHRNRSGALIGQLDIVCIGTGAVGLANDMQQRAVILGQ